MVCTTIREGSECFFMTAKGCSYNNGVCLEIVEQCDGCARVGIFDAGKYCETSPEPEAKWKNGNCNLATHVKTAVAEKTVKINPLKASKRSKK